MSIPVTILNELSLPNGDDSFARFKIFAPLGHVEYYLISFNPQSNTLLCHKKEHGRWATDWYPLADLESDSLVLDKSFLPMSIKEISQNSDGEQFASGGEIEPSGKPLAERVAFKVFIYNPNTNTLLVRSEVSQKDISDAAKIQLHKDAITENYSIDLIGSLIISGTEFRLTDDAGKNLLRQIHEQTNSDPDNQYALFYYLTNVARKTYSLDLYAKKFFPEKIIYKLGKIMADTLAASGLERLVAKRSAFAIYQPS